MVTPLIRRRQFLGALALAGTCLTLTSCTKDEFTIEGTWKSTGDNSWGRGSAKSFVVGLAWGDGGFWGCGGCGVACLGDDG